MKKPTNTAELVAYLATHGRVRVHHTALPAEDRTYSGHRNGGLWFVNDAGHESYLPIDCGHVAAESGFVFSERGFEVEKFGMTIRFDYL